MGWLQNGLLLALILGAAILGARALWTPYPRSAPPHLPPFNSIRPLVQSLDAEFAAHWTEHRLSPAAPADSLSLARRLSLALTGSIPSLEEIRQLETQPENQRLDWWLAKLFQDRRSSDYLAERFARVFVGTEDGPFLTFRRRRLVDWLSEQLHQNRPYNQVAQSLIASEGIWTTNPEVNFVTATVTPNKGPDEAKLATRVSRAFLGVRMDCVQCHDGKLANPWKQTDFHQIAAFFGQAKVALTGLHDDPKEQYKFRYLRHSEDERVQPVVPWNPELLPEKGSPRHRLAQWVTADSNRPFARALVNRVWALLFNLPLVTPVDDLPLEGPFPPGLELLASDFTAHGCDLHRLIRSIASSRVFQLSSSSETPSADAEAHWALFPITRLRPEQMAGSVIQASSLSTLDTESQVLLRLKRSADLNNFVKRYGDIGEDDFRPQSGTIPQRLLMMNGSMISNHTQQNLILNACSRIALLAPDPASAVESAYLSAFTRRPSTEEAEYFTATLRNSKGGSRSRAMSDLYWTLLNSTEFSWNH